MLTADMIMDELNNVRDEYILAAGAFLNCGEEDTMYQHARRMGKIIRIALIAAIIAALLTVTAVAANIMGLRERTAPPPAEFAPEVRGLVDGNEALAAAVAGAIRWSLLAPVGDVNAPETKAMVEWFDFERSYSAAMDAASKAAGEPYYAWHDFDAAGGILGDYMVPYLAADAVLAQKFLDICDTYGLKLHSGEYSTQDEKALYEVLGTDTFLPGGGLGLGRVFEDGSYFIKGDMSIAGTKCSYDLMFTVAGTMPCVTIGVGFPEVAEFEEWNYVNSNGDQVCIAQRVDAFDGYTVEGRTTFVFYDTEDACVYAYAIVPGGKENAEVFADAFDFAAAVSGSREVDVPDYQWYESADEPSLLIPEGSQAKVITILTGDDPYYTLVDAARAFNEQNGTYVVDFVQYTEGEKPSRSPDIYDLEAINYVNYNKEELLQNLKPFFNADADLRYEDLLPEVLEELELDGALYELTPTFGLRTLAGYGSALGEAEGFTTERLMELNQDYTALELFGGRITRESFFRLLLELDGNEYIDVRTGTCRFDSESFAQLLSFSQGLNEVYDLGIASPDAYAYNGELQLRSLHVMNMPIHALLLMDGVFHGDAVYTGFPSASGTGSTLQFNVRLGMAKDSKNQEGVWEFFRFLLSDEQLAVEPYSEDMVWSMAFIPVRRSMLDPALTFWTENYEVYGSINLYGWEDMVIYSEPDDGTAAARVMELAAKADGISWYDGEILRIIMDGAEEFYSGRSTAWEAAGLIQQLASQYLARQKQ